MAVLSKYCWYQILSSQSTEEQRIHDVYMYIFLKSYILLCCNLFFFTHVWYKFATLSQTVIKIMKYSFPFIKYILTSKISNILSLILVLTMQYFHTGNTIWYYLKTTAFFNYLSLKLSTHVFHISLPHNQNHIQLSSCHYSESNGLQCPHVWLQS